MMYLNIRMLLQKGAEVVAYDPVGEDNFKKLFPEQEITYLQYPKEALKHADLAFIFTKWKEITGLKLDTYRELMKKPLIFDGRNCYSVE